MRGLWRMWLLVWQFLGFGFRRFQGGPLHCKSFFVCIQQIAHLPVAQESCKACWEARYGPKPEEAPRPSERAMRMLERQSASSVLV